MDDKFMLRANELAKKRIGFVSPNPAVGAVIVKGDFVIAEGFHRKAGEDHAEVVAIKNMMKKSGIVSVDIDKSLFRNAVLYVTLEPCSHYGKTGPCAEAIVKAGFRKVCIGTVDPFAKVNGSGIKFLRDNGVKVEICKTGSDLEKDIRLLNQPFFKWALTGMPYVVLKAGMTMDGKIATNSGESKWISSETSRKAARLERSKCDAVLLGSGTVEADDCELAAHGKYKNKNLLRVVIDNKLQLNLGKKVFRDENVFVACSLLASKKNRNRFDAAEIPFKSFGKDSVSIKKLLKYLGGRGVQSLFVEGGSSVHGSFHDAALKDNTLVDRLQFYMAPKLFGGLSSLPVIGGEGVSKLKKTLDFKNLQCSSLGEDLLIEAELNLY